MLKNIWIINQAAGTPDSGWGERHYYIAKELVKKGYQLKIFAGNSNHLFINEIEIEGRFKVENRDRFQFVWVKIPMFKKSKSYKRILSWFIFTKNLLKIASKFDKPDVIVYSSSPMLPVLSAIFFKKRYKAKLIFEIRDIWPLSIQQLGQLKWYHPFVLIHKPLEKISYKNADYIVSVLQHADLHIKEIIKKKFNYSWIPNGISISEDNSILEETQKIIDQIPKEKIVFGYVGTIGIANALHVLLDVAELLKNENSHFIILGNGSEKENLKTIKQNKNLTNVDFYDKIPKNQVDFVVNKFSFGIVLSHNIPVYKYGISANKYFDYMKHSLPVVSIGNNSDPVSDSNCGINIVSNDPVIISNKILEFMNKPNKELVKLGENGQKYLLGNNTFKVLAQSYSDVIEKL